MTADNKGKDQQKPRILSRVLSFCRTKHTTKTSVSSLQVTDNPARKNKANLPGHDKSSTQSTAFTVPAGTTAEVYGNTKSETLDDSLNRCSVFNDDEPVLEPIRALGDSERTQMRYKEAMDQLEKCLARATSHETFPFLNIDEFNLKENNQVAYLREKIDQMLQARHSLAQNRNVLRRIFAAMTPFSKTLLLVAVQSQPVSSPDH